MEILYEKIKDYNLADILKIEESDRQFIALQKLSKCFSDYDLYLALIISNSIICYQLSGKWEDYWEEFSNYFCEKEINYSNLIDELINFISNSKNNKRLLNIKIKRVEKLRDFVLGFHWKWEYYYKNMLNLRDDLAKIMNQKKDAKTITFTIKMFGYWARNIYDFVEYPYSISIPIDSRLISIFDKYKWEYRDINLFYSALSNRLWISQLHFDALVWVNYQKLINT